MTADDLCRSLGCDRKTLDAWVRRGLPRAKNGRVWDYDAAAVAQWLTDQGLAQRRRVVHTQDQVAQALGKSPRMIGYYVAQGMPGRAGEYDLDAIEAWLTTRAPNATGDDARKAATTRLAEAKAARAEWDLAMRRGEMANVHDVIAWHTAHVIEARAVLQELVGEVPAALPEAASEATRKQVREIVDTRVRRVLDLLAAAARGPGQQP